MRNIVKQGNVIPVKLQITDCTGNAVLGKTLVDRLRGRATSTTIDDAGTVTSSRRPCRAPTPTAWMRPATRTAKYMYNLRGQDPAPNIAVHGGDLSVSLRHGRLFVASFVIQSKK